MVTEQIFKAPSVHYRSLDGVRGIAILMVVLFHLLSWELPAKEAAVIFVIFVAVWTLVVSHLSWLVVERPALSLKKYFEFQQEPASNVAPSSPVNA